MSKAQEPPLPNPYVGPRSFQRGQRLFGRDQDLRRLVDLLVVHRLVLLHAPSGAGKTSLIQAGLLPEMEKNEFWLLHPSQGARMNFTVQQPLAISQLPDANPFRLSLLTTLDEGLMEQKRPPEALAGFTIQDYLKDRLERAKTNLPALLIIDQFEEILTYDPHNFKAKEAFIDELAGVLADQRYWALLSMRDDYLGPMEPLLARLPTGFGARYHLDLLQERGAKETMQMPARLAAGEDQSGVNFSDEAAQALFDDLCKVSELKPDGQIEEKKGLVVEPVQLQIVCYNLWETLQPRLGDQIDQSQVSQAGYVDATLGAYYAAKVMEAARVEAREALGLHSEAEAAARLSEVELAAVNRVRKIRNWFERYLISVQKTRSQVMMSAPLSPPETGISNPAIWSLVNAYLVRAESRRGLTFFELVHDRLVRPVLDDNDDWRAQIAQSNNAIAADWEKAGRPVNMLWIGPLLAEAESWKDELTKYFTPVTLQFLEASRQQQKLLDEEARPPEISPAERHTNLEDLGWGVIFPSGLDPAVRFALSPLLEHRFKQATTPSHSYYKEFTYQPPQDGENFESAQQFLTNNGAGAGPVDPEKAPYYLLIVGGPQQIPFEFQYGLDVQYAVGRLAFDTPLEYHTYAQSVLAIENGQAAAPPLLALGAVQLPNDSDSLGVASQILTPLAARLASKPTPGWEIEPLDAPSLNKAALSELFNAPGAPSLVFLAAPTPTINRLPSETVCDRLGAIQVGRLAETPSAETLDKMTFGAADIQDSADLLGMIVFLYGPYTAGASGRDDYAHRLATRGAAQAAPPVPGGACVARLPQRLMAHPNGGALAVYAHVERSGAYAFHQETRLEEYTVFLETLRSLMLGYTAGAAKNPLDQRYTLFLSQLGERLSRAAQINLDLSSADPAQDALLSGLLTAAIDARNFVLLGDPAVRIPPLPADATWPGSPLMRRLMRRLPPRPVLQLPGDGAGFNLRSRPDMHAEVLAIAPPGGVLEIIGGGKEQGWWQVHWFSWPGGAREGWITAQYGEHVDLATSAPTPPGARAQLNVAAELAITVYGPQVDAEKKEYALEMELLLPGSDAALRLPRTPIALDPVALRALEVEPDQAALALGSALSAQLFSQPSIAETYARASSSALSLGAPLRLQLSLASGQEALQALPWETLRDPQNQRCLALDTNLLFSRRLWSAAWRPLELRPLIGGKPKVMLVASNPSTPEGEAQPLVDSVQEVERIRRLLPSELETVALPGAASPGAPVSLEAFFALLEVQEPDILYLASQPVNVGRKAGLMFAGEDGRPAPVNVATIYRRLSWLKTLPRLAILAAGQTGAPAQDPLALSSLASSLAQAGIPAVLVFQSPISQASLEKFLGVFFHELLRDGLVDRAVAAGRAAIADQPDFWSPALFSRVRNGQIWVATSLAKGEPAPTQRIELGLPPSDPAQVERPALLDQIVAALVNSKERQSAAVLFGLPGSGKTALAVMAANHKAIRRAYPDGVIFESLGAAPDLKAILGRWMDGLTGSKGKTYTDLAEGARDLAMALEKRKMLLILDDVSLPETVGPFLTGAKNCKLLITTNSRASLPVEAQMIAVDRMEKSESLAVLGAGLPTEERDSLLPLAEQLGYWPRALGFANQLLLRYHTPDRRLAATADYLHNDIQMRGLAALSLPAASPDLPPTSLTQYLAEGLSGLTSADRQALDALAIFPLQEEIPLAAVQRLWAAVLHLDEAGQHDQVQRLWKLALIYAEAPDFPCLSLQPLLQRYLVEQLGARLPELHAALLDAYGPERWTQWPGDEPYIWDHAAYHLLAAGRGSFLAELLLNVKWIQARLNSLSSGGMQALLRDYNSLPNDLVLQRVRRALRLSAHRLRLDPGSLHVQLLGRLLSYAESEPRLRAFLEQARREAGPGLLPLSQALDGPDGLRMGTLPVYGGLPNMIAISSSARVAVAAVGEYKLSVWDLEDWAEILQIELPGRVFGLASLPDPQRALVLCLVEDYGLIAYDAASGELLYSLDLPAPNPGDGIQVNPPTARLAVSPDGRWALTITAQGAVLAWDLLERRMLTQLSGTPENTMAMAIAAGGLAVIGGVTSESGDAAAYNLAAGAPGYLKRWKAHESAVTGLAFSSDGKALYSLSSAPYTFLLNNELRVWSVAPQFGALIGAYPNIGDVFAPPATASGQYDFIIPGTLDSQWVLRLAGINANQLSSCLAAHSRPVAGLAITSDGTRMLTASADGILNVWDLTQAAATATAYPLKALAFTPSGKLAVSQDDYGLLKTWDLGSWIVEGLSKGRLVKSLTPLPGYEASPNGGPAGLAVIEERRVLLATRKGDWVVWDLERGAPQTSASFSGAGILGDFKLDPESGQAIILKLPDRSNRLDFSLGRAYSEAPPPSQQYAAEAQPSQQYAAEAQATQYASGAQTSPYASEAQASQYASAGKGTENPGPQYSFVKSERSAANPAGLVLFDPTSLQRSLRLNCRLHILRAHRGAALSWVRLPDGKREASSDIDGVIHIWDSASGTLLDSLEGHRGPVNCLAAFPDGKRLLSAGQDTLLYIWDLETKERLAYEGQAPLLACAVAPDGRSLLAGDNLGRLHILEIPAPLQPEQHVSMAFEPAARFLWQNLTVRSQVYPAREGVLRDFLSAFSQVELNQTLAPQTAPARKSSYSEGNRLAANLRARLAALARMAHDDLLAEMLDWFKSEPDRFPDWLKALIVHVAGMRAGTAHGSWADPQELLALLARDVSIRLAEPAFREQIHKQAVLAWQARLENVSDDEDRRAIEQTLKELDDPVKAEATLNAAYLFGADQVEPGRTPIQQTLDILLIQKERLAFPDWFWREVVRLTDLRLAVSGGDWLNDWETLSLAEIEARARPENQSWRRLLEAWQQPRAAWRAQHRQDFAPLVTRLLSSDLADHAYHLRGLAPGYGLGGRAEWLAESAASTQGAYFKRLYGREDLKSGASLLRLAWLDRPPYPWEVAVDLPSLDILDREEQARRDPEWVIMTEQFAGQPVITRRRVGATRPGLRLYKSSRQAQTADQAPQWLAWVDEAIVVEVVDLDEPTLLTLECAPQAALKRSPLKDLLHDWSLWVGYHPEAPLTDVQKSALAGLLDPAALQTQARPVDAGAGFSEIHAGWSAPPPTKEVATRLAKLDPSSRRLVALLAFGLTPAMAAASLGLPLEAVEENVNEVLSLLNLDAPQVLPELLAGYDFGPDQPRSSLSEDDFERRASLWE